MALTIAAIDLHTLRHARREQAHQALVRVDHVEAAERVAKEGVLDLRALVVLLLAHGREVDEEAKVGRREHRLVAELLAVGVLGAILVA